MSEDFSRRPKVPPGHPKKRGPGSAPREGGGADELGTTLPEILPRDALGYVAVTLAELARLSRRFKLDTLAYMIEVAHLEAQSELQSQSETGEGGLKPGRP